MGEIRLSHCCRLCLKEGFTLTNIFSQRSAAGDPLYQILNFIYEMKIFENDGLPSQICSPCMWRMIEFDACKKNVRSAEAEILRLLSQTRPVEPSEVEVAIEQTPVNSEVSIKEEIDIVEWEMPTETAIKVPEAAQHFQEANEDDYNDLESDNVEPVGLPEEEYKEIVNEEVFSQPLKEILLGPDLSVKQEASEPLIDDEDANQSTGSSELKNFPSLEASEETTRNSFDGSSICTPQDNSIEMRDTKKGGKHEEDVRVDVVPEEESSGPSKSVVNETKSDNSLLIAPLSKSMFVCDICRKSFKAKYSLGNHVRVHYNDRPFCCSICDKTFKNDKVRYIHELMHLRDEVKFGKSEKGRKIKQYSCPKCSKNFCTRNALYMHSNLHSNRFKCNTCGKHCASNADLGKHLRIHTKEKPYKCEVCLKCFNQKGCFNNHLRIHSSERPYSCEICEKRFKSKGDKTRHELFHLRKK